MNTKSISNRIAFSLATILVFSAPNFAAANEVDYTVTVVRSALNGNLVGSFFKNGRKLSVVNSCENGFDSESLFSLDCQNAQWSLEGLLNIADSVEGDLSFSGPGVRSGQKIHCVSTNGTSGPYRCDLKVNE